MPDLLLELFSEEIPARMQRKAADDLKKLVTDALVERGFVYEGAKAFATPRRLALHIAGLPAKGQDVREEKKGPRNGAPMPAVHGFLKSLGVPPEGVNVFDTLQPGQSATAGDVTVELRGEGDKAVFFALVERPGRPTLDVLAEVIPTAIRNFPWPKSMRWGAASREPGSLRWVRPLQSILATFGPETEEPEVVRFSVDGIEAGNQTFGHRFLSDGQPIPVRRFDDYMPALERAKVVLDADRRKEIILADARNLAFAQGLELVEDEGLLEEVAGLVEWPIVLMGAFDEAFLAIPPEVIRATIRANQKCFVTRDGATGALSNRFLLVANLAASDGGKAIVAGNERVVRARLSDARHFWELDRKPLPDVADYADAAAGLGLDLEKPLDQRMAKLAHLGVVFHEKLGSQGARVARIAALARELAPLVGADASLAERAARIAKADLSTEMVGEFPELQGLMGRYYATLQGEHASVQAAMEDHYKPLGPSDRVPADPVAVTVALADKLDTLVGFWAIDEKPTGSKDPYALRRSALGVIRLVVDNGIRLRLAGEIAAHALAFAVNLTPPADAAQIALAKGLGPASAFARFREPRALARDEAADWLALGGRLEALAGDLLTFFHDRLKVMLREQGAKPDVVDAVLAAGAGAANDDLLLVTRRVEALTAFLASEDGANLAAGYKRAANILRAEEKKDGTGAFDLEPDYALIAERGQIEEKALAVALAKATQAAGDALGREDYAAAMSALAGLRQPVDAFFEAVTVNADDPALRANRLRLLAQLRNATRLVADFGALQG